METDQSVLSIIGMTFVPMLICAALLRSRGITGMLAVAGVLAVLYLVFTDMQNWKMAVGGISAMFGLIVGGQISDVRERRRLKNIQDAERKKKEAVLKSQFYQNTDEKKSKAK